MESLVPRAPARLANDLHAWIPKTAPVPTGRPVVKWGRLAKEGDPTALSKRARKVSGDVARRYNQITCLDSCQNALEVIEAIEAGDLNPQAGISLVESQPFRRCISVLNVYKRDTGLT